MGETPWREAMKAKQVRIEVINGQTVEVEICPPSRRRAAGDINKCRPLHDKTRNTRKAEQLGGITR